jgi:hypothetical protein
MKDRNPEAYDELKKRLLNEYKKLVSSKKVLEDNGFRGKEESPKPSSGGQTTASMNVYKPTFIINNSFQAETNKNETKFHRSNPSKLKEAP